MIGIQEVIPHDCKQSRGIDLNSERGVTHGSDRPVSKNTRDLYGNETAGGRSGQGRNLQGLRRRTEGVCLRQESVCVPALRTLRTTARAHAHPSDRG